MGIIYNTTNKYFINFEQGNKYEVDYLREVKVISLNSTTSEQMDELY